MGKSRLPVWPGGAKPSKKKKVESMRPHYAENLAHNVGEELVPYQIPTDLDEFCGIMFVAEAPGENEVAQGKPLVGTSGKHFNKWLAHSSIERDRCIIANTFRFRPLNNRVENFFVGPRIAAEQEIELAAGYEDKPCRGKLLKKYFEPELVKLHQTIETYRPDIVVTMGGIATWALLGRDTITELQGRIVERELGPPGARSHHFYVLPCFHPSSALPFRSPQNAELILDVFARASKMARAIWRQRHNQRPALKPEQADTTQMTDNYLRGKRRARKTAS